MPLVAIAATLLAVNFELAYNIMVYGKMSGPCVRVSDYVDRLGGSMDDPAYNEDRECCQNPDRETCMPCQIGSQSVIISFG